MAEAASREALRHAGIAGFSGTEGAAAKELAMTRTKTRPGFTLVEILIVVIILGILAAIVVPQFSGATKDAKRSGLMTMVQSLRTQIEHYRLQHNDQLPNLVANWDQLTLYTDRSGATSATKVGNFIYGPYLQLAPRNQFVAPADAGTVVNGKTAQANCGFVYDYAANTGSGKIWAIDSDGTLLEQ